MPFSRRFEVWEIRQLCTRFWRRFLEQRLYPSAQQSNEVGLHIFIAARKTNRKLAGSIPLRFYCTRRKVEKLSNSQEKSPHVPLLTSHTCIQYIYYSIIICVRVKNCFQDMHTVQNRNIFKRFIIHCLERGRLHKKKCHKRVPKMKTN